MWRAVEIMRAVEAELKTCRSVHTGRAKLIATHGNRLVLYMALRSGLDPNDSDLEATKKKVPETINPIVERLIEATGRLYESSYPGNLFKNLTKCKNIAKEMGTGTSQSEYLFNQT